MRLELRPIVEPWRIAAAPVFAIAATLLLSSGLVLWAGAPVGQAFLQIVTGGFGSMFAWSETLTRATPLILTGLAAAISFRARFFNIGGEGQLYLGALATVVVGGLHGGEVSVLPPWFLLPEMMIAAALAGAALALGPALLREYMGVDEVVTTLLLNFVVLLLVSAALDGPMKDPMAAGWPQSVALQDNLLLDHFSGRLRVSTGLFLGLAAALVLWIATKYTVFGFRLRAVGANAAAARFAGIRTRRVLVQVALLSGALAGLAGAVEVAGRTGYVTLDMSPGYGFSGITIAMLAALHPIGVVVASIFVAGVLVGADSMSRAVHVPTYISDVIVSTSLLCMLVSGLFAKYRLRSN